MNCTTCGTKVGALSNYGDSSSPLCYDCANHQSCVECNKNLPVAENLGYKGRTLCKNCQNNLLAEEKRIEAEQDKETSNTEQTGKSLLDEEYLEFSSNSILWKFSLLFAALAAIFALSCIVGVLVSQNTIYGFSSFFWIAISILTMINGNRIKKHQAVYITKHALHYGKKFIALNELRRIESNDSNKAVFWLGTNCSEYQQPLNLNAIVPDEQEKFRRWMNEMNLAIKERTKINDTGK